MKKPELSASQPFGLSQEQVNHNRAEYGQNDLSASEHPSRIKEILRFLKDPMGLMMLTLGLLYFLLGETSDGITMVIAFIPVIGIDVFLELKSENALKQLHSRFSSVVKVFRDGKLVEVSSKEIVVQDWIVLEEGQVVPADGIVESCSDLSIDESALTGESIPVLKNPTNEAYTGTTVLSGRGVMRVSSVGLKTRFGKIIRLLSTSRSTESPLQIKMNQLVARLLMIAIGLVICLLILQILRGKSLIESILVSLTFGMSCVPEEFPLVFTLYLSLGAWRLARSGVLIKNLPSVETLGSVNVICTDKTGTLTEGKFQLTDVVLFSKLPEDQIWRHALLACEPIIVDTMEVAIKEKTPDHISTSGWSLLQDYPFNPLEKLMSHAWKGPENKTIIAMKGSIEGVLNHCAESYEEKEKILNKTAELSAKGFRLLGLAGKPANITGNRMEDERDLHFLAILAFSDPIRASAREAIKECQNKGIQIKMITGDHPLTAHSIADQLEIIHSHDGLYTGSVLAKMTEVQREQAYLEGSIFARVTPEQKHELVDILKKHGKIVAMTGDGINDAPALKSADIGISMGQNATDTARETAKMILLKNDFNGIIQAISEGRRLFSNLKKSFSYLISFHIPIILLSLIPPVFNWGELFLPVHIILLELIVHPVSAFTFENLQANKDSETKSLVDSKTAVTSIVSGLLVSMASLWMFYSYRHTLEIEDRRNLAMITLLFGNIGFIILESLPSWTKRLTITITTLLGLIGAMVMLKPLQKFLHTAPLQTRSFVWCLSLGILASVPLPWLIRTVIDKKKV